jgi:hypothetical protein
VYRGQGIEEPSATRPGRDANVTGYQRGAGNRSLYALKDAPRHRPEGRIDPI